MSDLVMAVILACVISLVFIWFISGLVARQFYWIKSHDNPDGELRHQPSALYFYGLGPIILRRLLKNPDLTIPPGVHPAVKRNGRIDL